MIPIHLVQGRVPGSAIIDPAWEKTDKVRHSSVLTDSGYYFKVGGVRLRSRCGRIGEYLHYLD